VGAPNSLREVTILLDGASHLGDIGLPESPRGLVLFAHGSGSSRLSRRNRFVAEVLRQSGIATLLFDLLTEAEDRNYERRFDIALLTHRLLGATAWVQAQPVLARLPLGYFGASTGAAAALCAAADEPNCVSAVVSRGGRPDLASEALPSVRAPTLLVVGGFDDVVITLNEQAYEQLRCEKKFEIVAGATHLFEEPGTLEEAARLATQWFLACFARSAA